MLLYTDKAACDGHVNPPGHPEQVARAASVLTAIEGLTLDRREAPLGSDEDVLRCHPARFLELLRQSTPAEGWSMLDGDTQLSPGSLNAALHAVGGACAAVDAVLAGEGVNEGATGQKGRAFVAMRPPGHHTETEKAMGFCLLGTVAIAAKRALDHHGLSRVAVLDFDVHHGNGTQDLLWDEGRALFVSSHQSPLYPGSGSSSERGAHGQILNLPLRPMSGGEEAREAWAEGIARMIEWQPELVLISAGFDAHEDDPLANLRWTEEDFAHITHAICAAADLCNAPVVSCLEGGYDLAALGRSARAHVEAMMEVGA